MATTLDFGGDSAVDLQDPAAAYGQLLAAFIGSQYYYVLRGYGEISPLSFRNAGDDVFQVRLWGSGFQYIDGDEGVSVDPAAGFVTRIEIFEPDDLAANADFPPTHSLSLTLGDPAPMAAALDALFAKDFSPLYAGEALAAAGTSFGDHLLGGTLDDTLSGRAGADTLEGGGAADELKGGGGADVLDGGGGKDTLTGGAGRDAFVFENKGSAAADRITDFTDRADKIHLDLAVFPELLVEGTLGSGKFKAADDITAAGGGATVDSNDRILYDSDSGRLYYDSNGSADGGRVLFATVFDLGGHPDLAAGDFRVI